MLTKQIRGPTPFPVLNLTLNSMHVPYSQKYWWCWWYGPKLSVLKYWWNVNFAVALTAYYIIIVCLCVYQRVHCRPLPWSTWTINKVVSLQIYMNYNWQHTGNTVMHTTVSTGCSRHSYAPTVHDTVMHMTVHDTVMHQLFTTQLALAVHDTVMHTTVHDTVMHMTVHNTVSTGCTRHSYAHNCSWHSYAPTVHNTVSTGCTRHSDAHDCSWHSCNMRNSSYLTGTHSKPSNKAQSYTMDARVPVFVSINSCKYVENFWQSQQ